MTTSVIASSTSISKGISIINTLDVSKFSLLLSRIVKTLHSKEEKSFTETEVSKLQSSLNLSAEDVALLLETLHFILEQAAYHLAKPSVLSQQLLQIGMNEDKALTLIQAWTSSAKGVVQKLAQRTVAPEQLESVNWRLNLEMGHSRKAKLGHPVAVFEFGVRNDATKEKDNVLTEFTHDELYAFYDQLETIQAQLDSLR